MIEIAFRQPDGETVTSRRFFTSDKIGALYAYVDSLGEDIFIDSDEFELMTPFPQRVFSDHKKTLGEEGITNKELLQIREL